MGANCPKLDFITCLIVGVLVFILRIEKEKGLIAFKL